MLLNPFRFAAAPVVDGEYPKLLDYTSASLNTASSSHSIPLGTYAAGDLLVIYYASRSDNTTSPTMPSGWRGSLGYSNTTPTPDGRKGYMYRVMTGSEGSSVTLTFPDSRAITYNRLRFQTGTFDSDLGYMFQFGQNSGSGTTADPANTLPTMYFKKATVLRNISLFGLASVSAYPFPSGEQTVGTGTGLATSSAKSYANVGQDIMPPTGVYDWSPWTMDASSDYHEVNLILRGSAPLGHIDPRSLFGFSFSSDSDSVSIAATGDLNVGDMLILMSQATTSVILGVSISGSFTTLHTDLQTQVLYRVVTAGDIGSNLTVTYGSFGKHSFQVIRVRAGTFEAGAVPQVIATGNGTSASPATASVLAGATYAGKRNLALFFEGQIYTSTVTTLTAAGYTIGPVSQSSGVANAASCGCAYQYFDGATVPAASGTLNASASWRAATIILKGLPIPA